ncbi:MAG: SufE family protein [Alphaproteobacteria bacterium]|nr:SufE family protein [Alphaproteobacteria bacterium]
MAVKNIDELADGFALFDNWEDKYRYLIDLGQRLDPMDEALKTEETRVRGCTSQVWMIASQQPDGRYHFIADSDAMIVSGLVYVLMVAYQDKTAAEIAAVDIEGAFERLGLSGHLSPSRRNGFFAMVQRIRALSSE